MNCERFNVYRFYASLVGHWLFIDSWIVICVCICLLFLSFFIIFKCLHDSLQQKRVQRILEIKNISFMTMTWKPLKPYLTNSTSGSFPNILLPHSIPEQTLVVSARDYLRSKIESVKYQECLSYCWQDQQGKKKRERRRQGKPVTDNKNTCQADTASNRHTKVFDWEWRGLQKTMSQNARWLPTFTCL